VRLLPITCLIVTLICLAASASARADWIALGEDRAFVYHVAPATLRGDRARRTVMTLFNARSADQSVGSMRMLIEADCSAPRARVVSRSLHPGPMGAGAEMNLPIARAATWDYTRSGTAIDEIRRFACAATDAQMTAAGGTPATAAVAPVSAAPARATSGGRIAVPMQRRGGTFSVPVLVNEQITLRFIIDSGAADVSLPSDVVATLVRNGTLSKSDFLGKRNYVLADGSRFTAETYRIRSLRIGDRVVENVTGTVGSLSSPFLLGQSFLRRLKSWSIDNANELLLID